MGYMVIRADDTKRVFLDEIAVLVIENPAVSITGCLIEALVEKKIKVIFCDSKYSPVAELVPQHGSHDSSAKIRAQIGWAPELKAAVWREIVYDKISKQSAFLRDLGKKEEAELLRSYLSQIEPGDATNREGHAAKVYFNALFGMDFTRSAEIPINAALNYGYSLILSTVSREVSTNGYLTQIGLFHDNMFNHFNLSCDLMEPFRIAVDRLVYDLNPEKFEKEEKHKVLDLLNKKVRIDGCEQYMINAIKIYVRGVFDALNDNDLAKIKTANWI